MKLAGTCVEIRQHQARISRSDLAAGLNGALIILHPVLGRSSVLQKIQDRFRHLVVGGGKGFAKCVRSFCIFRLSHLRDPEPAIRSNRFLTFRHSLREQSFRFLVVMIFGRLIARLCLLGRNLIAGAAAKKRRAKCSCQNRRIYTSPQRINKSHTQTSFSKIIKRSHHSILQRNAKEDSTQKAPVQ